MTTTRSLVGPTCEYCRRPGHVEEDCRTKKRYNPKNQVRACYDKIPVLDNVLTAMIQGHPISVLIDSGSEVSLITKSLAHRLRSQLFLTHRMLRVIGGQELEATTRTILTLEFPEVTVEADLYLIPDQWMDVPLILGTDVLNRQRLTYTRTGNKQRLTRTEILPPTAALEVNMPVEGETKTQLLKLINKYSEYFISGTAITTVTTGQMTIKLNSDSPVNYRPYKLSQTEK